MLRLYWFGAEPMISHDGCLYLWNAMDVLGLGPRRGFVEGQGDYVLIASLYPYLTALVSFLVDDLWVAAKVISFVAGLALPLAVGLLIAAAGDRTLARWTAALAFVHPAILPYGLRVQTEALYHLLLYLALAALWHAAARGRAVHQGLTILLFALAALTRHEGAFFLLLALAILGWTALRHHRQSWWRLVPLVLLAALLLAPRVYLVHARTGVWALRPGVVANLREKTYGYELDAQGQHLHYQHDLADVSGPGGPQRPPLHVGLLKRLRYLAGNLLKDIFEVLPGHLGLVALVLIGMGLAGGPLVGSGRRLELMLGGFVLATVLGYAFFHHHPRYLVSALPALLVFAVHGLRRWPLPTWTRPLAAAALLVPYLWLCIAPLLAPVERFPLHLMGAGLWIGNRGEGGYGPAPLVLSGERWSAFYSGGRQLVLPDAPVERVLDYARYHGATHMVLSGQPLDERLRAAATKLGLAPIEVIDDPSGKAWIYAIPRPMDTERR